MAQGTLDFLTGPSVIRLDRLLAGRTIKNEFSHKTPLVGTRHDLRGQATTGG
jgi:hypothetical protein